MLIDAHHHVWRLDRGDYDWLTPALAPIHRDFSIDDLTPHLRRHGVERTILVQAAPTVAETEFLLATAARNFVVAGVVGWVDFEQPDAAALIARLAGDPLLVGLRPMVQDIADDEWLLRADLAPAFAALIAHGLVFDALVLPRHLSRLLALVDRHLELPVVVDHLAKPLIRAGIRDPWRADIAALAARPKVVCKLSGIVTEAAAGWTVADLRPYVEHALAVFGPERVLWGSDWPVVNLAADYRRWISTAEQLMAGLDVSAQALVFGGNALCMYLSHRGKTIEC